MFNLIINNKNFLAQNLYYFHSKDRFLNEYYKFLEKNKKGFIFFYEDMDNNNYTYFFVKRIKEININRIILKSQYSFGIYNNVFFYDETDILTNERIIIFNLDEERIHLRYNLIFLPLTMIQNLRKSFYYFKVKNKSLKFFNR